MSRQTQPRFHLASKLLSSVLTALIALPAGALAAPAESKDSAPAKQPTLAVVAIDLDSAARPAAKLSYFGEKVTGELGRHQLKELWQLLDPQASKARLEKADEAKYEYDIAKKYYDDLDVTKAAEHCDRSLSLYEKSDLSRAFPAMAQSWMLKIAALIANAEVPAAQAELNLMLPVDSKSSFDPNIFAPDFISQVRKRRDEIAKESNLTLDVDTKPVPARVFIDGRYRGVTPVELHDLPAGDHYLTLMAPGYSLLQKRVRGGAGRTEILDLERGTKLSDYESAARKISGDIRGAGRDVAARELAQNLGVDQLLILGVTAHERGRIGVLGVRVAARDGHELSYLDESLPDDENAFNTAADSFLHRVIGADLKRGEGGAAVSTTGGGFEWQARHTGYVLLGASVLALASGVYFGLAAKGTADTYKAQTAAQTNGIYKTLESQGKQQALIADVSYLGGAILGGTGLFLAVTGRSGIEHDEANQNIEERRTVTGVGGEERSTSSSSRSKSEDEPRRREEPKKVEEAKPADDRPADEDAPKKRPEKKKKKSEDDDLRDE